MRELVYQLLVWLDSIGGFATTTRVIQEGPKSCRKAKHRDRILERAVKSKYAEWAEIGIGKTAKRGVMLTKAGAAKATVIASS